MKSFFINFLDFKNFSWTDYVRLAIIFYDFKNTIPIFDRWLTNTEWLLIYLSDLVVSRRIKGQELLQFVHLLIFCLFFVDHNWNKILIF